MANLVYAISASLDGYIADKNGNFDWTHPSEEVHAFFNDLQRSVGTFLCGRRMYETMRVWDTLVLDDLPEVQREFAEAWRATDKVVYSTTLDNVPEPRTRLERTFGPEVVQAMKDDADRDLSIGGAGLAAEAIRAGLVDRYLLRLVPTIVGGGTRALPDTARVDLALNTTRRFEDGSVLLDYGLR
jgi:dihydrofolate reductase